MENEKIYKMAFSKVFPLLLAKAVKKGRTEEEVFAVTNWLTGYPETDIRDFLNSDLTYGDFFKNAPAPNPGRKLITGKICGIAVETIEEPLMQEIRYLDKLIDELSKGKSLDKILRTRKGDVK